jgi:uncharacterized protein YdhG (YjbR/CyaY superfamily)
MAEQFDNVDDYVAAQPQPVREILDALRARVRARLPAATESISYGIPTFKVGGKALLYVAAWKHHIAVYPVPDGDGALERDVARYRSGKGTLKFMLAEPFPFELFDRLVQAAAATAKR